MAEADEVAQEVDGGLLTDVCEEAVEGLEEFLFVRRRLCALEDPSTEADGWSSAEVEAQLAWLTVQVRLEQVMQWAVACGESSIHASGQVCRGYRTQPSLVCCIAFDTFSTGSLSLLTRKSCCAWLEPLHCCLQKSGAATVHIGLVLQFHPTVQLCNECVQRSALRFGVALVVLKSVM